VEPILNFIDSQENAAQRDLLLYFHHLFVDQVGLRLKMRYGIPFYDHVKWVCYLSPTRDGGVEVGFTYGNRLSNVQGLLEVRGRKQVRSVTFYNLQEVPEKTLLEVLFEAVELSR
jgi:hypothetical protein